MRRAIEALCCRIGADPLLTQGAGGNVSWKESRTLWVKASGTWLAHAADKDIFVPVDLQHLTAAIESGDFSVTPRFTAAAGLRPSIETLLHGLMPHPIVVHLHAVDVLAHLVRADFPASVEPHLRGRINWLSVPYHKPGAGLAQAIASEMRKMPRVDLVMMQSHGIVIGGRSIAEIEDHLSTLTAMLRVKPRLPTGRAAVSSIDPRSVYEPVSDELIHELAFDPVLFNRLGRDWALYPDHVVFLGPRAVHHITLNDFLGTYPEQANWPAILFIKDAGVFAHKDISEARLAQLRCYYDVLARQDEQEKLTTLNADEVSRLLDWDAEKYRMAIST